MESKVQTATKRKQANTQVAKLKSKPKSKGGPKTKKRAKLDPSDPDVLEIILTVSKRFANKFKFGYHQSKDIEQQAAIFAIEALDRFVPEKGFPLENFLTIHVRNRLINFKRDKYCRAQPPCVICPFYNPKLESLCIEFDSRLECDKYSQWVKRNESKKKLMTSGTIIDGYGSNDGGNVCPQNWLEYKEIMAQINEKMPVWLRADFNRLLEGITIPKNRKDKIEVLVREILGLGSEYGTE